MSNLHAPHLLARRSFGPADQERFAKWSGDRNPMHMDAKAARRTNAGAQVVHGAHALLWALDEALAADSSLIAAPMAMKVEFRKYVFLDQEVALTRVRDRRGDSGLELTTEHGLAMTIKFRPARGVPELADCDRLEAFSYSTVPNSPTEDEMAGLEGWLAPADCSSELAARFAQAAAHISDRRLTAIAQLSRLVGMVCPGLHSIFTTLDLDILDDIAPRPGIGFRVLQVDRRYRLVRIAVSGSGLLGTVTAFVRPDPVRSQPMDVLAKLVPAGGYANRRALVIGGTRGLGAVTAKMIAAGGGNVTLTYAQGVSDAEEIRTEIEQFPGAGRCTICHLDITLPLSEQLDAIGEIPTHIYYYPTPKIFLQKPPEFHAPTFHEFLLYYVDAFFGVCKYFLSRRSDPLFVLYPSSIAVEERPQGMTEYAMAKAAGELLCADLMQAHPGLRIRVSRLPRTLTDQTTTIALSASASAEAIVLPLLGDQPEWG